MFLQATSPLRQPGDIDSAIKTLQQAGADSLFSACHVEGFVWHEVQGEVSPLSYDPSSRPRRQALEEEILEENGSIYLFKPWVLREHNSRLGGKIAVHKMSRLDSFQVDTLDDLLLMEQLLTTRQPRSECPELAAVRLLVLDFDGVMTDNRALVDEDGREAVFVNRSDGWGIARLKEAGIEVVVLSTETSPVVAARCRKLGIDCIQGYDDKLSKLEELAQQRALSASQIAYVGNDVNDADCMRWVGVPIAVNDAVPGVRSLSRLVTTHGGGDGAVREVAEWMLAARKEQSGG